MISIMNEILVVELGTLLWAAMALGMWREYGTILSCAAERPWLTV